MNKFVGVFVAMIMIGTHAAPLNAQAAILVLLFGDKVASENFYFSLKVGANVTNLDGLEGTKWKTGWNFGLLGNIKLSENFSLVPEFAPLSQKGAKEVPYLPSGISELDGLIAPPDESTMSLNYIDMPVIAQYRLGDRFSIGTGPQFGYLTSSKNVYETEVQAGDELQYSQESQLSWNKWDFGWAVELTFTLADAREARGLNIHARYTKGLTDIIESNPGDAVTNSTFQFFVSLPFILTGEDEG
jgi:long-subunit fatty acid transport protein